MAVRREEVRVTADISSFTTRMAAAGRSARSFATELEVADSRLSNMVQTTMALGPALVPLGAAAVPAVAGLATQLGFAAAGAGVAALAFSGMGDALTAVNEYQLEPTAANLDKMREALDRLSPAAQDFAMYLHGIRPELDRLQDAAQEGLFPGAQAGLQDLMTRLPEVESIISTVASTMGGLLAEAGDNLADSRWTDFFAYIDTTARPVMTEMGHTLGNFAAGTAELWMALDPMSRDFSRAFLQMSRDFETWASALAGSEGLESFIDYINQVGPQAWDTLGAIADSLLALAQAAAPVGAAVLPVVEILADTLAVIARSDAGPVLIGAAAGLSAVSRAVALYNAANGSALGTLFGRISGRAGTAAQGLRADAAALVDFGSGLDAWGQKAGPVVTANERLRRSFGQLGAAGAGIGLLTASLTDLDDQLGITNTAMLGFTGGALGGLKGLKYGAAVGGIMDIANAFSVTADEMENFLRVTEAQAGGNVTAEIQAITAEIERLQQIMDEDAGVQFLGGGLWWGNDAADAADQVEILTGRLEELRTQQEVTAITDQRAAYEGMLRAGTLREQASAADDAADGYDNVARAAGGFTATLEAMEGLLDKRAAFRNYQQALDDFTQSIRDNGRSFDVSTDAGRRNQESLDAIANTAGVVASGMGRLNRIKFMENAAADIRARAQEMGLPAAATQRVIDKLHDAAAAAGKMTDAQRRLITQYHLTPKQVSTLVEQVNMGKSRSDIRDLLTQYGLTPKQIRTAVELLGVAAAEGALDTLTRDRTVNVFTRQLGVSGVPESLRPPTRRATGGPVYGPGSGTSDSIPAWLSNGEYVIRAAAVERYGRAMFDHLNAMRLADGGMVLRAYQAAPMPPKVSVSVSDLAGPSRSFAMNLNGPIYTQDPKALARELEQRGRDSLALSRLP